MMATAETGDTDTAHGPGCRPQPDVDGGRLRTGVVADVPCAEGCARKAEMTLALMQTAAVAVPAALLLDATGSLLRPGTLASLGRRRAFAHPESYVPVSDDFCTTMAPMASAANDGADARSVADDAALSKKMPAV